MKGAAVASASAAEAALHALAARAPLGGACAVVQPARLAFATGSATGGEGLRLPKGNDSSCLGEGANALAFAAVLDGTKRVCLRVVVAGGAFAGADGAQFDSTVKDELTWVSAPSAVRVHGLTWVRSADGRGFHAAQVLELCKHGSLLRLHEAECLPVAVKIDALKQTLRGLRDLRDLSIVWRDLKAENLLLSDLQRDATTGSVRSVVLKMADWGTAVPLQGSEGVATRRDRSSSDCDSARMRRRMTLHGPGTAGYVAPDTSSPRYGHEVDMWAFLVMAADLCIDLRALRSAGVALLEQQLDALRLSRSTARPTKLEAKVKAVLSAMGEYVADDCKELYEVLLGACWVHPAQRWDVDEAMGALRGIELTDLGGARHPPASASTIRRPTSTRIRAGCPSAPLDETHARSPHADTHREEKGDVASDEAVTASPPPPSTRCVPVEPTHPRTQRQAARSAGLLFSPPGATIRARRPRRAAETAKMRMSLQLRR